jgi:hypothetical protein
MPHSPDWDDWQSGYYEGIMLMIGNYLDYDFTEQEAIDYAWRAAEYMGSKSKQRRTMGRRGKMSEHPKYGVKRGIVHHQAMGITRSRSPLPKKRKRTRQSPKQKLLQEMADKAWKKYKRTTPKGKKTYIQIRAQVSRSQAYKKKAKRLG